MTESNITARWNVHPWFLPLLASAAAVAYGMRFDLGSALLLIVLKMTPALAMALEVIRQRRLAAWPIAAALTLHAAGDGLLNLGRHFFLAGMVAFLIGHFGYIAAFLPHRYQEHQLPRLRRTTIIALVISMTAVTLYVWPMLTGLLVVASPLYSLALTGMAITALLGDWNGPGVPAGAMLFVLSDVLLGLRLFAHQESFAFAIWPTYAAAQIVIPFGYLNTPVPTPRRDGRQLQP